MRSEVRLSVSALGSASLSAGGARSQSWHDHLHPHPRRRASSPPSLGGWRRNAPLEIVGHGSKRGIGRPLQAEHTLDLSALTGVTLYEPEELVLSAKAGTPLAEIEALLAEHSQKLAFEPMDYGPLLGGAARASGTIGGVLAANLSGPRRIKAGAARDHILGINAVSGRGEAFKSGGRVVKNVTGYDLSKLMAGSWGTLAVVTDVTFKVLPAAETETTLAVRGLLDDAAAARHGAGHGLERRGVGRGAPARRRSPARVAGGCARRPTPRRCSASKASARRSPTASQQLQGPAEGRRPDRRDRRRARRSAVWRDIRDCVPFADGTAKPVWRVSMRAVAGPPDGRCAAHGSRRSSAFLRLAGRARLAAMDGEPGGRPRVRRLVRGHGGGHATLVRAAPA